jgi:hypothetical protein
MRGTHSLPILHVPPLSQPAKGHLPRSFPAQSKLALYMDVLMS